MRVLWMSHLLFGLAACGPVTKSGINSGSSSKQPYDPWYSGAYGGSSAQSPGSYQAPVAYFGYNTYPDSSPYYYSPELYAAYVAPYPEGYKTEQFWWADPVNSASVTDQGPSQENTEFFFTDVYDLDPVHTVSGRSRYRRGKVVFSKTHYVPGNPTSFRPVQGPQPVPELVPQDPQQVPQPAADEPYSPVYIPQKWGF